MWQEDIVVNNDDTYFVSRMYVLNEVCYLTASIVISQNRQTHSNNSSAIWRRIVWVCLAILWDQPSILSMVVFLFHRSTWRELSVKDTTFISQHLEQPSTSKQVVCSWCQKIWMVCLFEESHCSPALLKLPIYFAELVAVIFVWKILCESVGNKARVPIRE